MDDAIQFYRGASLPLVYEFRDPQNRALPFPLVGWTATVINNTTGQVPVCTVTDPETGDVTVKFSKTQTAAMEPRTRGSFQLCVSHPNGIDAIVLPPTEVMPL